MKKDVKGQDLLNWRQISGLLANRDDIVRKNRVQKQHKEQISELLSLIDYWLHKNGLKNE